MPSEGDRSCQIHLYVPQEADSGRKRAGNGAGKAYKGRICRKQGKIRRKKDSGITARQRPSGQSQSGPEDHEEAGTEGKDGKEKKDIQLLHGNCRKSRRQPSEEKVQSRYAEHGICDRRHRIRLRLGKGLPVPCHGPLQQTDHRIRHIQKAQFRSDKEHDVFRIRRKKDCRRSSFPQRPGMAVSDEGVPGNAFRPGTEAVDVKEGKLP